MKRLEEIMARIGSKPALICAARISDDFGDAADYQVKDGIATIDVTGPLSNAAWSWGGTTYGEIQEQVSAALADPACKGILLNVNSPGGETDMAFETAALVAKVSAAKPCYAVAATMAYSAAYLIASQASKVYCTEISGGVGSIGVYCAHFDYSEMLKKNGVTVTLISAGEGKTDGSPYQPLSDTAKEDIQAEIDRLYGEFIGAVSKGRGITPEAIVKLGARCYEGAPKAMSVGLADASGDLTKAFNDLCAEVNHAPMFGSHAASAANSQKESTMAENVAEPKKMEPAEIEALVAKARSEAAASGRAEMSEILDLCAIAGTPAQALTFIKEGKSVAEVRTSLLTAKVAEQAKSAVDTTAKIGTEGHDVGCEAAKLGGKAKPWREVLISLGLFKKEGK